jgi:hypothetical protein
MKNDNFHIPFLHSLIFIASCTIIFMIFARGMVIYSLSEPKNHPDFATQKFDIPTDTPHNNPF